MGVLQDFERRLEGAVEGFFARAFRSDLQPIELAKAIRRYAEDTQYVTEEGVLVPNVYRFQLNPRDLERFESFDTSLRKELGEVVAQSAREREWRLRGPVLVRLEADDEVAYGRFELAGRVEPVEEPDRPPTRPADSSDNGGLAVARPGAGGRATPLTGPRLTVGRLASCDVVLDDPTVSREHAAFVHRNGDWWLVDLGSTNGTLVNGRAASEQRVSAGDRIEFGEATLELVGTDR